MPFDSTVEKVFLQFEGSRLSSEIPLSALAEHITQSGNPGNRRGIRVADVRLPAELLRRGFFLIDTPGLGSAISENTKTTESFLPEADAFLLITSYDAVLSEEEVGFLRREASLSRRIFVVVNKHDTVSAELRPAVLAYVDDQLRTIFDGASIPLFSVSASEARQAQKTRNSGLLAQSGIPALEDELVRFIVAERRQQILRQMSDRAVQLVENLPVSRASNALASEARTLAASFFDPEGPEPPARTTATHTTQITPNIAQLSACEICREVSDALWKFECQFQYDICEEPTTRRRFTAAGGLCSFHTWQYHNVTSAYGVCNAYPPLLDQLARKLRAAACEKTAIEDGILSPQCTLCSARNAAETEAISRLCQRLLEDGDRAFETLSAICIPHLQKIAPALRSSVQFQRLLLRQADLVERVSEDMRRFALKVDATRRFLESKEETTAAERGLLLVAGQRDVSADAIPPRISARAPNPTPRNPE